MSSQYKDTKKALQERFEPSCVRNRYQAKFQTVKKEKEWADFADRLQILADKAFEFEDKTKEQLALNVFLAQLDDPQVAFSMMQKRPTTLDEAVSATLETECYAAYADTKLAAAVEAAS